MGFCSLKRQAQQKKRKERERKELEVLGRRHFANVRVVQRNVVYVTGLGPRFAKEEVCDLLDTQSLSKLFDLVNTDLAV